ncbi:MAG: hypothetical protein K6E18_04775 [Lachnospiraceae bacterium]|nr:hypothetical protein [Lachnospiraceae bacterium]
MLDYNALYKKRSIDGRSRSQVSLMLSVLEEIAAEHSADQDPFYAQLNTYTQAMRTIVSRSSFMSSKENVTLALRKMEGFEQFLQGSYPRLVREAKERDLKPERVDAGLMAFSNFVEMGLQLEEIKKAASVEAGKEKQEEPGRQADDIRQDDIQEKKEAPPEDAPLVSAEEFDKRSQEKKTFAAREQERKAVNAMNSILSSALTSLNSKIEAIERKDRFKRPVSEQERAADAENKKLRDAIRSYYSDIKILNESQIGYMEYDSQARQEALDHLKGFQGFLEEGRQQTNLSRLLSEAALDMEKMKPQAIREKFQKGLEIMERSLHFGLNAEKAMPIKQEFQKELDAQKKAEEQVQKKKDTKRSADKWIEGWKASFAYNRNKMKNNPAQARKYIVYIMTSRQLAGAKPDAISILMRDIQSQYDIENKAREMLEKPGHMKDFLDRLMTDQKLMEKAQDAAAKGHGGGLDALFKDYLKNLPPGQLKNDDPGLKRFMPTVKERIEALQEQAKAAARRHEQPTAQAAEIVVLRNMIKAERGVKASLDHPIPLMGKDFSRSLSKEAEAMMKRESFRSVTADPKVLSLIKKGHGGEMLTEMRKVFGTTGYAAGFEEAQKALREGTVEGRLEAIKEEAGKMGEKLGKLLADAKKGIGTHEQFGAFYQEAKNLIAEDIALSQYYSKFPQKEGGNIPWRKIRKMQHEVLQNETMKQALYPDGNEKIAENMQKRLQELSEKEYWLGFYENTMKSVTKLINADEELKKQAREAAKEAAGQAKKGQKKEFEIKETRTTSKNNRKEGVINQEEFEDLKEVMLNVANGFEQKDRLKEKPKVVGKK